MNTNGYIIRSEQKNEAVDAFDRTFPPKVKQKLPGQLF